MNQPTHKEKMETILLFGSSRATAMLIIMGMWLSISAHAHSLEISLNKPEWQKKGANHH